MKLWLGPRFMRDDDTRQVLHVMLHSLQVHACTRLGQHEHLNLRHVIARAINLRKQTITFSIIDAPY
jgi:hypothetical protein